MRTKTSPIWTYFDVGIDDPSFAICKKCKAKLSRGSKIAKNMTTTNLKRHLAKSHGADIYKDFLGLEKENMEKKRKAAEEEEEEGTSDGHGPFSLRNKERKTNYLQQAIPDVMAGWQH